MLKIKKIILKILNSISKYISIPFLLKITKQKSILPFYHTVANSELLHIKNLYKIKSEIDFIKDLDFLLQHFEALDYNQFKNNAIIKPSFLLTFDDGLKEFYTVIAPILLKKNIPAICFLNSDFVDNNDLFYRYKASLLVEKFKTEPLLKEKILSLNINDIETYLLKISYKDKDKLNEIAEMIDYSFKNYLDKEKPYLTSKQILELKELGFYFGAHSKNHPEYQYISEVEQIKQTKESVDFITKKYHLNYKIFSFPFTDFNISRSFFNKINDLKIIETTFGTAGQKKDEIINNFQRIPFENKNMTAKEILKKELLYFLLKMPFGKNKIKRK